VSELRKHPTKLRTMSFFIERSPSRITLREHEKFLANNTDDAIRT
jgi:hypothetical protein